MSKTQIIGLVSFLLSHLFLVLNFALDSPNGNYIFLFYLAWAFGVMSVISNVLFADATKSKTWITAILALSGLFWFFPPLLATFFGFPFLIIFFVVTFYTHLKKIKVIQNSNPSNC